MMERTKRIPVIKAVMIAACLSFPSQTLANVQEACGLSPKATAMGNAFSAVADDFSACYYNPAGLVQNDHHSLYVGYMMVLPRLKQYLLPETENMNYFDNTHFRGPTGGAILDLSQFINLKGHRLVMGVAASVGNNLEAGWRINDWDPSVPQFFRSGDYMNRLHTYAGLGFDAIPEKLSIGVAVNVTQDLYVTSLESTVDILQNVLAKSVDIDGDSEISPIVGVLFKPLDQLSFSCTWRDGWRQNAPANLIANVAVGDLEIPVVISIMPTAYYLPWNVTTGVAWQINEDMLVSMDLTYYGWSSFNLAEWHQLPKQWKNTLLPRFGMEYRLCNNLMLRGGYYFDPTPIPDQSDVTSNHLDSNKHTFSLGLGYTMDYSWMPFRYPLVLDYFFQTQLWETRRQEKEASTGQTGWYIEGQHFASGIGLSFGF